MRDNSFIRALAAGIPAALSLLACGGTSSAPRPQPPKILVAGYQQVGAHNVAMLWTNGAPTPLTDGTTNAKAVGVAYWNGDVYVVGVRDASNGSSVATYWKNGTPVQLTDGSYPAFAEAICFSGNDIYIAGYENNATGGNTVKYWKNGTPIVLGDPANPTAGEAFGIAVNNNDVYVVGWSVEKTVITPTNIVFSDVAKVWKNGVLTRLTDPATETGQATGVFLDGSNVYISGHKAKRSDIYYQATYWKNGVPVPLKDSGYGSKAFSVNIHNGSLLVGGFVSLNPAAIATVWEDGIPKSYSSGGKALVNAISFYGNDMYMAGMENNAAMVWSSTGIRTPLTDGSSIAEAKGICVVP